MRWIRLVAAAVVVSNAAWCFAETPEYSNNRPQPMSLMQGRLFGGQAWWARFGEPVNATAMAQAEVSPSDKTGPMPLYGDGGYVYSPGACDCSAPCISHLWNGYYQNPKRCNPHQLFNRHCGCNACDNGCGSCGHCHPMLTRLFGHGCCNANSCTSAASCGCAAPVCTTPAPSCAAPSCGAPSCEVPSCAAPSCTTTADCGCKPLCGKSRHCHFKLRSCMAHWSCGCDSCSAPVSCGCATPAGPALMSEKQATNGPPVPMAEEAALFPLRRLK